jgi:phytoene dehydrogenase-like protein
MPHTIPNRRDVLRSALALLPGAALDWNSLPRAQAADTSPDHFDAVIVGTGLGGLANIPIQQAEEVLLPGLSKAIEVKEVATPLTNVRYTGNYHGAIYGWDQTLDNSNPRRLPHVTPVRNLYLAGAWRSPGGGYSAVMVSGLECFGEITARTGELKFAAAR